MPSFVFRCNWIGRPQAGMCKEKNFLYSGVMSFENEIIPCFDFLSSEHSKDFLDIPLKVFRNAVRKNTRMWPIFSTIVTDYCLASLQSLMDIFNEMTVSEYIHKMYRYSNNLSGDAPGQAFTLCCAHFMKMAARDIRTAANDDEERMFNITLVGNILNASTFSEADSCIRALVTVLLTKRQNLSLMRSFNLLRKFTPEQVQQTDPIEDFRDEQGGFHERSPFYKEYSEVAMEVINAGSDEHMCRTNITTKVGVGPS